MIDKNKDIEVLRAIAILFVIILHLNVLALVEIGPFVWLQSHFDLSIGVDLFFVISGYVIAHSLYKLESQSPAPRRRLVFVFWIRRFFRLAPTALLWLLIAACYVALRGSLWGDSGLNRDALMPFIAAALHVVNFYGAYCIDTLSPSCDTYFIHGHYWSLSLEEQFYFIIPLLFFGMNRRLFMSCVVLAIALLINFKRPYWSYGWFFRIDGFCWGILLAYLQITFHQPHSIVRFFSSQLRRWVCILLLCLSLPYVSSSVQGWGDTAKSYGVGVVALICAAIVAIAALSNNQPGPTSALHRTMHMIGARSYSLYVSHLIIFYILKDLWAKYPIAALSSTGASLLLMLAGIGLAIFATELNYRYIETNLRAFGRRLGNVYVETSSLIPLRPDTGLPQNPQMTTDT